jgi:hypothetical protein
VLSKGATDSLQRQSPEQEEAARGLHPWFTDSALALRDVILGIQEDSQCGLQEAGRTMVPFQHLFHHSGENPLTLVSSSSE